MKNSLFFLLFLFITSCSKNLAPHFFQKRNCPPLTYTIIGGHFASTKDYPSILSMSKIFSSSSELETSCSLFFIHPKIFLTAAHCFPDLEAPHSAESLKRYLKISSSSYSYYLPIRRYSIHPEFKKNILSLKDLAVGIVDPPLDFKKAENQYDLNSLLIDKFELYEVLKASPALAVSIFGYGLQEDDATKGELRQLAVSISGHNQDEILTFDEQGSGNGADSGGPAIVEINGKKKIIGLISRLKNFNDKRRGTYLTTFVTNRDFICQVLKNEKIESSWCEERESPPKKLNGCEEMVENREAHHTLKVIMKKLDLKEINCQTIRDSLKNVTAINLSNSFISDLSPLLLFSSAMKKIDLSKNMVKELGPLSSIATEQPLSIDLSFNFISPQEMVKLSNHWRVKGKKLQFGITSSTSFLESCLKEDSQLLEDEKRERKAIMNILEENGKPLPIHLNNEKCHQLNSKLLSKKEIDLSNQGLRTIHLLKDAPLLESLDLSFNEIEDISPLLNLESLIYLNLIGNDPHNLETILSKKIKKREGMIFHFQSFWERLK